MPETSSISIDHFPSFLARLPPDLDLEALGRQTKAFQRARGVRSVKDLLRLALAWAVGGHSQQSVAAWAHEYGIASLSEEALHKHLHTCVDFLKALTGKLLEHASGAPCWHGRSLRIADSTSLSIPGSKGTDFRVHGVYDLGAGGFTHLEVTDSRGGEALDRGKPVAGEIRIADRGYANAQAWQRFLAERPGETDFIVRMRWNTIRLVDGTGKPFDLIDWLARVDPEKQVREIPVLAQSGKRQTPIPIRLIAWRKTPEQAEAARKQLYQRASRKQSKIDPRSLVAAEYIAIATSLDAETFPAEEVLAAYRLRWQIELAFKRLKSLLNIDDIRTRTDTGTRCWLYAHLIVALLHDDLSQDILASFPSGPFRGGSHQFPVAHRQNRARRDPPGDRAGNDAGHAQTRAQVPA